MKNKPFVGVAGNIGVGKTTFTKKVSEVFGWSPYYESVIDNPYLNDFYKDMHRWSFNLQIYFLYHRFRSHQEMLNSQIGVIQDRTIYEDVEIFAKNLYKMQYLTKRDWNSYKNLFEIMIQFIEKPHLIIYLRATTDTLISRIKGRSRDFEKDIDIEYLYKLNVSYEKWIKSLNKNEIMIINTDDFNIFEDKSKFKEIIFQITDRLSSIHLDIKKNNGF